MLRIPHCVDNRLTDGGKVVSPNHRLLSAPQKHNVSVSGTNGGDYVEDLGVDGEIKLWNCEMGYYKLNSIPLSLNISVV
jgi:hypothetical protein